MKVIIFGAGGMLGNTLIKTLSQDKAYEVYGTLRKDINFFDKNNSIRIFKNISCERINEWREILMQIKPDIIINCIGIVKQLKEANDPQLSIFTNSLFPHQLHNVCREINSKLIHISTDCVFSGKKGLYSENDKPDSSDLYGLSKLLGEINSKNSLTIRTSIIGHSINSNHGLIDWFLKQNFKIKGYRKAIFSGLTTLELSNVILKYVLTNNTLNGIVHISNVPISKFDLLNLVSRIYKKSIIISPDDNLIIDRSLNSKTFIEKTGYIPPSWETMIEEMYFQNRYENSKK
tara:strand:- start:5733 stop:6602 length:870 start_codon:yes stop_codon:yes gene_type:complete